MKRNRRNRNFNEEIETKKIVYISVAVVIIAILAFALTYVAYSNILSKKSKTTGEIKSKIAELSSVNNETTTEQASSQIGKSVNEVTKEESSKIAINTSNIEKSEQAENKIQTKQNEQIKENVEKKEQTANVETKKQEEKAPEPTFIKPIEGEIIKEFANENLIYSETLKEWVTHNGIDIKAQKASIVKATEQGTVSAIKNDPRYGITVVIEHTNGYVSIYSYLLTAEFVKEGEKIKQGQTIGTVGNTAVFEIADESHLHFEMLKDNKYINPSEYIK